MPAPAALAPVAWKAAQLGAVAAVAWYAARKARPDGPREIWRERVLDDVEEGVETDFSRSSEDSRMGAAVRWKRGIRLGGKGPGVEIDFSSLTRLKLRRL